MIKLKWSATLVAMLFTYVLTHLLFWLLPVFVVSGQGPLDNNTKYGTRYELPKWLSWFQTPDNSIDGDQGWREEHMQWRFLFPAPIATYLGRVGWLLRNPAYGIGLAYVDYFAAAHAYIEGNLEVTKDPLIPGFFHIDAGTTFHTRKISKLPFINVYWCRNYGWNICGYIKEVLYENKGALKYRATFAFNPISFKKGN